MFALQAGLAGAQQAVPVAVWAASALVGVTVAAILFCSHFHQIEGDRAAGKMSPLVRLGPTNGMQARVMHVGCSVLFQPRTPALSVL